MPVETGQATWGIYCPHCRDWHSTVLPRLLPTLVWFIVLVLLQYYVSVAHIVVHTRSLLYSFTALIVLILLQYYVSAAHIVVQHKRGLLAWLGLPLPSVFYIHLQH